MKYDDFKREVENKFMDFVSKEIRGDYSLDISTVNKKGMNYDGLKLIPKERNDSFLATPVIYIEDMYAAFCEIHDINKIIVDVVESMLPLLPASKMITQKNIINNVIFRFQNINSINDLNNLPYRKVDFAEDFVIVYELVLTPNKNDMSSPIITLDLMKGLDYTEEDLYNAAYINTKKRFPGKYKIFFIKGAPIFILSNESMIYGAINVLYCENLEKISKIYNEDIYIFPASINEVFFMPVGAMNYNDALDMLRSGNKELSSNDILSNDLLYYDKKSKKIIAAKDIFK